MMEKGSFHDSQLDPFPARPKTRTEADDVVRQIPLPNQMPKGLEFSEIPASILKTATMETLLSQNEDLMARLSVALRKGNALEDQMSEIQAENGALKRK